MIWICSPFLSSFLALLIRFSQESRELLQGYPSGMKPNLSRSCTRLSLSLSLAQLMVYKFVCDVRAWCDECVDGLWCMWSFRLVSWRVNDPLSDQPSHCTPPTTGHRLLSTPAHTGLERQRRGERETEEGREIESYLICFVNLFTENNFVCLEWVLLISVAGISRAFILQHVCVSL